MSGYPLKVRELAWDQEVDWRGLGNPVFASERLYSCLYNRTGVYGQTRV